MKSAKSVDEYITTSPAHVQNKLKKLRKLIKTIAPDAQEKISYGMPYYGYKGRLVYFAYMKNHIGLYIPPPVIEDHKNELKTYVTAVSTVRFPLDKDLPLGLIRKLVKARMQINQKSKRFA